MRRFLAGLVVALTGVVVVLTVDMHRDEPEVAAPAAVELLEPRVREGAPSGDPFQVEVAGSELQVAYVPDRVWMWRLFDSVNRWRVAHRLLPIELNLIATKHADKHSVEMADAQHLHHSTFGLMPGYRSQGETVGRGGDPYQIQQAFIDSPGHKELILRPEYDDIGIAAVRDANGAWWVTYILGLST